MSLQQHLTLTLHNLWLIITTTHTDTLSHGPWEFAFESCEKTLVALKTSKHLNMSNTKCFACRKSSNATSSVRSLHLKVHHDERLVLLNCWSLPCFLNRGSTSETRWRIWASVCRRLLTSCYFCSVSYATNEEKRHSRRRWGQRSNGRETEVSLRCACNIASVHKLLIIW